MYLRILKLLRTQKFRWNLQQHKKIKKLGVSFFTGIPDSLLKNYCYYIDDYEKNEDHIIAANEGGALAIAMGYNLATGKIPLIYLQNSGFGNLVPNVRK